MLCMWASTGFELAISSIVFQPLERLSNPLPPEDWMVSSNVTLKIHIQKYCMGHQIAGLPIMYLLAVQQEI